MAGSTSTRASTSTSATIKTSSGGCSSRRKCGCVDEHNFTTNGTCVWTCHDLVGRQS